MIKRVSSIYEHRKVLHNPHENFYVLRDKIRVPLRTHDNGTPILRNFILLLLSSLLGFMRFTTSVNSSLRRIPHVHICHSSFFFFFPFWLRHNIKHPVTFLQFFICHFLYIYLSLLFIEEIKKKASRQNLGFTYYDSLDLVTFLRHF